MKGMEKETPYFKGLNKKDYIQKTREIIDKEGVEAISIRRIAREMGCSSASLYRHFDNLTELIYFAEMHTLTGFIERLNEAEKKWDNIWDYYVGIWDCYSREAFRHPLAYNLLFLQFDNAKLNISFKEYYQMFPEAFENANQFFMEMLETSDFMGRDFQICKKCVAEGVLDYDDAVRLNRQACLLYEGYFKYVFDHKIPEEEIDTYVEKFVDDIDWIIMKMAKDLRGYNGYGKKRTV